MDWGNNPVVWQKISEESKACDLNRHFFFKTKNGSLWIRKLWKPNQIVEEPPTQEIAKRLVEIASGTESKDQSSVFSPKRLNNAVADNIIIRDKEDVLIDESDDDTLSFETDHLLEQREFEKNKDIISSLLMLKRIKGNSKVLET